MEDLYTLHFEGLATPKGRDEWFEAMPWEYWDESPQDGGWLIHCEAPTTERERFDDLKAIGNNEDYTEYGTLELREANHFGESRRYDRLIGLSSFLNVFKRMAEEKKLEGEEDMEETKSDEPISAECGLDVEGEKESLKKLKKEFAKLYKESQGRIVVDYAQWNNEKGRAEVSYHWELPDDLDEYEYKMRSLAYQILFIQNELANHEDIERYMELRKRKGEDDED